MSSAPIDSKYIQITTAFSSTPTIIYASRHKTLYKSVFPGMLATLEATLIDADRLPSTASTGSAEFA